MRSLATWMQDVLREYELSVKTLAYRSRLSAQTIYNLLEPTHSPNVMLGTLASLARGLGLQFDTVLAQLCEQPQGGDPLIREIADQCLHLGHAERLAILRIVRSAVAARWREAAEG